MDTPCREYQGATTTQGYGVRKHKGALHRWVWEQVNGPIPDGKVIMHICDTRACFRYEHLQLGTQQDNMQDMVDKGRWRGPVGEGHPLAKLSEASLLELRTRYDAGESQGALAEEYGVHRMTVNRALKGHTWKGCGSDKHDIEREDTAS